MSKELLNLPSPKPSWIGAISPIFIEHATLFPSVPSAVEMADYSSWEDNYKQYLQWFNHWNNTGTIAQQLRFLTDFEKKLVLVWLQGAQKCKPLFLNIDSKDELMKALQIAIELEFATIPPYLTAMFSLKGQHGGRNDSEIYRRFHRILMEEMKHFALACNMLVAIGGKPVIHSSSSIPKYPGPLPGGVGKHLEIHLAKFSMQQLTKLMFIEIPDVYRVPHERMCVTTKSKQYNEPNTIGNFYAQIEKAFEHLDNEHKLSYGNPDKQVDTEIFYKDVKAFKIHNLQDAKRAIRQIVVEGEGGGEKGKPNPDLDPFDELKEVGHYYKFAEIYYGKAIQKKGEGYCYSGAAVPFDPSEVYDFPSDPNINDLTPGTKEYEAALAVAMSFETVLKELQQTFCANKDNAKYLNNAITEMKHFARKAQILMKLGYGPSFQLPPSKNKYY